MWPSAGRGIGRLAAGGGDEGQPTRRGEVAPGQVDECQRVAVGADAVQEVVAGRVVADPGGGPAGDRGDVEMPVVGGQVDQPRGASTTWSLLIGGRSSIGTGVNATAGSKVQPPQQAVTVEQQPGAVRGPVRRLEQQLSLL